MEAALDLVNRLSQHFEVRDLFSFPDPVNEVSARLVAGGVVLMAVPALALHQPWLLIILAVGFLARVLTGPKLSPLGLLATRVITPSMPFKAKFVPGPPKRFAQCIGFAITTAAAVLYFGFGLWTASAVLLTALIIAATLESVFAICLGCQIFALLMRIGVIPGGVCEECAQLAWIRSPLQS